MKKYFAAWFPMILIAVANGFFREAVIKKSFSVSAAHQISTVTLMILLFIYMYFIIKKYPFKTNQQAAITGVLWCLLTLAFEFGFGHFIGGQSWVKLTEDYYITEGRIWVLIPLFILIAPYFLHKSFNKK